MAEGEARVAEAGEDPAGARAASAGPSPLDRLRSGWKGLARSAAILSSSAPAAAPEGAGAGASATEAPTAAPTSAGTSAAKVPAALAQETTAPGAAGPSMNEQALSSLTAWAGKARKAVAAQVSYDVVPQMEGHDIEKGGAGGEPAWATWAKAAAGRAKQQVESAAGEAGRGLAQGVQKAKSTEWSDQVARGIGNVTAGVGNAGASLQEKNKVAMQKAKELSSQGTMKFGEATSAAAKKAQQAKDKAGSLGGAATDRLKSAGSSLGGLASLSMSPVKLAQFAGIFMLGMFLISMSFSFLPLLAIAPQKFALLFTFGSMTIMGSVAFLKGPGAFLAVLMQREKLPFSGSYVVGLLGTLVGTLVMRSYLLTVFFAVLQVLGLLYFLASYVPGGKAALNFCGRLSGKLAARTVVICRKK